MTWAAREDLALSTVSLPAGWRDSSAMGFWEVSSLTLFLKITHSCYLNSLFPVLM